jgi:hypothetical protein
VPFCCYNRINTTDYVIKEKNTFISQVLQTRKSSFQVLSSGMELLALLPMEEGEKVGESHGTHILQPFNGHH